MHVYHIFKKCVIVEDSSFPLLISFACSSLHYHVSSGILFAADIYRYKYSSTSPYIVNTIRDNERILWISACLLAVSSVFVALTEIIKRYPLVFRAFQLSHPPHAAITTTRWNKNPCNPIRFWLWPRLFPELLHWNFDLAYHLHPYQQHRWYVHSFSQPFQKIFISSSLVFYHLRGCTDGLVGGEEARELQKRIQRVSASKKGHNPFPTLSWCILP